jgi:hypothetical protein
MTLLKYEVPGHRRVYTAKAGAAHPGAVYPTEACAVSGCVYSIPQRHVLHIDASTLQRPVLSYIIVSSAASEGVYTTEACTSQEMSTLQGLELHLDVSILKRPVLLPDVSTLQRTVLHLDVSTLQRPELHLDVSTLQRPVLLLEMLTLQRP